MGLKIKAGCGILSTGFVPIRRRDVGYFEFEGGMRYDIVQNAT